MPNSPRLVWGRNYALHRAIYDNWPTAAAFCREHGFRPQLVSHLINLRYSPFTSEGVYREVCLRMACALEEPPAEIFPREIYDLGEPKAAREIPFSALMEGSLPSLPSPEGPAMGSALANEIESLLTTMPARQARVVELYYGMGGREEMSYREVAESMGCEKDEVMELKTEALRHLRHPSRRIRVRDFLRNPAFRETRDFSIF